MPTNFVDILVSGLMGLLGGLITIPINAYFSLQLKRDEISYQHRLALVAKEKELYLQHRLETKRMERENEIKRESEWYSNSPLVDDTMTVEYRALAERVLLLEEKTSQLLKRQDNE